MPSFVHPKGWIGVPLLVPPDKAQRLPSATTGSCNSREQISPNRQTAQRDGGPAAARSALRCLPLLRRS